MFDLGPFAFDKLWILKEVEKPFQVRWQSFCFFFVVLNPKHRQGLAFPQTEELLRVNVPSCSLSQPRVRLSLQLAL